MKSRFSPFLTAFYLFANLFATGVFAQTISDDLGERYENGAPHSGMSCPNGMCEDYTGASEDPAWPVSYGNSQEERVYVEESEQSEETYDEGQEEDAYPQNEVIYEEENTQTYPEDEYEEDPYEEEYEDDEEYVEEKSAPAPKSSARKYYIRMDFGLAINESDVDMKGVDCENSWLGCDTLDQEPVSFLKGTLGGAISKGIGLGVNLNSFLRLDLSLSERSDFEFTEDRNARGTTQHFDIDESDYIYDTEMTVNTKLQNTTAMLSLYIDFFRRYSRDEYGRSTQSAIAPYIGVGIGYTKHILDDIVGRYNSHYTDMDDPMNPVDYDLDGTWRLKGGESSGMAWTATAGVAFALSKNLWLDIAYRYLDLGTVETASEYTITMDTDLNDNGITDPGDLDFTNSDTGGGPDGIEDPGYIEWDDAGAQEFDLTVHEVTIGLRYEF